MKDFIRHNFSPKQCKRDIDELANLLRSNEELGETKDILPFFKKHLNLSAFLGTYVADICRYDLVAHEYDLFGDFSCDVVVGDSQTKTYLFVELEDAKPKSVFVKKKGKATPEWSNRFEHGFSQIVDWFWKLSDMTKTDDFENRFEGRYINIHGLLIVGRNENLRQRECWRLQWWQKSVRVDSNIISCITYDDLLKDLQFRIKLFL